MQFISSLTVKYNKTEVSLPIKLIIFILFLSHWPQPTYWVQMQQLSHYITILKFNLKQKISENMIHYATDNEREKQKVIWTQNC